MWEKASQVFQLKLEGCLPQGLQPCRQATCFILAGRDPVSQEDSACGTERARGLRGPGSLCVIPAQLAPWCQDHVL